MKLLYCDGCSDYIPFPNHDWSKYCKCGNARCKYTDHYLGTAVVDAIDREKVRIIGIHNGAIDASFVEPPYTDEEWIQLNTLLVSPREGEDYKVSGSVIERRKNWICICRMEETTDCTWFSDENLSKPNQAQQTGG
jgi:hypothetical protein